MKRILFAATFAALTLGAAQAASLSWQTGSGEIYNENNGDAKLISPAVEQSKACASASFALSVTFTQAIGSETTIAKLGQWDRGHMQIKAYSGNQDLGFYNSNPSTYSQPGIPIGDLQEGGNTFVFVLTYNKISDTETQVIGYIGGQKVIDLTTTGLNGLNAQIFASDAYTVNGSAAYNGVLSAEQAEWLADNKTVVLPEPTALALLAIGVAGVALRRRVA